MVGDRGAVRRSENMGFEAIGNVRWRMKQPVGRGHLTTPPSPYKTLKRMRIVPNFIAYPHPPQKVSKNYCNLHKVRYTKAVK